MVDKEIISKILNNTIVSVKCKIERVGLNSLNNILKNRINRFQDSMIDAPVEHMQCFDNKGNVLFEKEGTEHQVKWNHNDIMNALDYQMGDLTQVHNHPHVYRDAPDDMLGTPTMFSKEDVENLWKVDTVGFDEYGGEVIGTIWRSTTCTCPNGSRMTLTRKDNNVLDNFVVDNYLADEFGEGYPLNNKDEFMDAYNMLKSDWVSMHKRFKSAYDDFTMEWISTHGNKESIGYDVGNYDDGTGCV